MFAGTFHGLIISTEITGPLTNPFLDGYVAGETFSIGFTQWRINWALSFLFVNDNNKGHCG